MPPKSEAKPVVPDGFVAVKPKEGQWLVSLDRERFYGPVTKVGYENFSWDTGDMVVNVQFTWEEVQHMPGRYRFVDELPAGFTREGNGWRP